MLKLSSQQLKLFFSLIFFIALGLFSKFYQGPYQQWVNDDSNGIFYVVCWALLLALLFPKQRLLHWVWGAFLLTCALECLQLWQTPLLLELRSQLLGRLILGSHFAWLDFPYYAIGGLLSWVWLRGLKLS